MKILVLGASGMLGHKLAKELARNHSVFAGVRDDGKKLEEIGILSRDEIISGVEVMNYPDAERLIKKLSPEVIINAIGVVKQHKEAENPLLTIEINSLLPHRLAETAKSLGARVITFSTDCVFDGEHGGYSESDRPNADDLYGRSKTLGELKAEHCVTIRSSIIGRELESSRSLVEWVISNRGKAVTGYANALYSGFTTLEMSRIVDSIVSEYVDLSGIIHVSSEPISKFDLIRLLDRHLALEMEIGKDTEFRIDRTLDSSGFREKTGFRPKSWDAMISEFAAESGEYDEWRKIRS